MTQAANTKQKPRKVRGIASIYEDDTIQFTPYNEAPSTQKDVKTCVGGGKRWTTIGADPSKVIHLMCKESSTDQYAELAAQFVALTKDMKPSQPLQLPDRQRLVNEGGMQVFLNQKEGQLTYQGQINLAETRNWQSELMRQLQLIVRTLPAEKTLTSTLNKIKKGGQK